MRDREKVSGIMHVTKGIALALALFLSVACVLTSSDESVKITDAGIEKNSALHA